MRLQISTAVLSVRRPVGLPLMGGGRALPVCRYNTTARAVSVSTDGSGWYTSNWRSFTLMAVLWSAPSKKAAGMGCPVATSVCRVVRSAGTCGDDRLEVRKSMFAA